MHPARRAIRKVTRSIIQLFTNRLIAWVKGLTSIFLLAQQGLFNVSPMRQSPNPRPMYYYSRSIKTLQLHPFLAAYFLWVWPSPSYLHALWKTIHPPAIWEGSADQVSTFHRQGHWNPLQTALFLLLWHLIPSTGHSISQGTEQLIYEVVMAQGHWLVPLRGGIILVLGPQQLPFPHLRRAKTRCLLLFPFQKNR